MAWQRIASLSEIAVDAVLGVDVDGSRVALYRLANEVFATAGICTHAMALLSDGFVEDGNIECPLHQSQFDIRSGKALCAPATEDLRTYAVKLDGDEILIDMEQQAEFTQAIPKPMPDRQAARPVTDTQTISATNSGPELALMKRYAWPAEGLTRIPDWVYTDQTIYEREVEKIFHGRTWNYVALECEVPNPGDFIRSNVGPTPVVVVRAADCSINVFENRCSHRAAEFCRELSGNTKEFVCPYHQWSYDLHGNLAGIPFRRGVNGKGGMPADFNAAQHGLRRLNVTSHRGVVFASYVQDMEPLQDYLGPEVLKEFEATFDGRKPRLLGYYRHTLPGNWKLYHENLKDPYHATLLHTFLVTFGLLVAGNRSLMLADATGRTLAEPRFMDFIEEFDSPWSVTMATIWPNLIIQREMNTLGVRQIVPTGPHEFIMKWTMFGFEGDDDEMTRHRLRQGNLMGPAGFLGLEDNEAIKFVQDGMRHVPGRQHLVKLDPAVAAGTSDSLISEASIRAMYRHWRAEMGL